MNTGDKVYALVQVSIDQILEQQKEVFINLLTRFALAEEFSNFTIANFQALPVGVVQGKILFEITGVAVERPKPAPVPTPVPEVVEIKKEAKKQVKQVKKPAKKIKKATKKK